MKGNGIEKDKGKRHCPLQRRQYTIIFYSQWTTCCVSLDIRKLKEHLQIDRVHVVKRVHVDEYYILSPVLDKKHKAWTIFLSTIGKLLGNNRPHSFMLTKNFNDVFIKNASTVIVGMYYT